MNTPISQILHDARQIITDFGGQNAIQIASMFPYSVAIDYVENVLFLEAIGPSPSLRMGEGLPGYRKYFLKNLDAK